MTAEDPIATERDDKGSRFASMERNELEALAIAAIQQHRKLLAADEFAYSEWVKASKDALTTGAVLKSLQDEYLSRQRKSEAQQNELSEIIDALGYIPEVSGLDS